MKLNDPDLRNLANSLIVKLDKPDHLDHQISISSFHLALCRFTFIKHSRKKTIEFRIQIESGWNRHEPHGQSDIQSYNFIGVESTVVDTICF
jgi:hypothetical protein